MPDSTPLPVDPTPENTEKPHEPPKETGSKNKDNPKSSKPVVWPPHHPVRTFFAAIFGAIALILILVTILVAWFNRTITDTDTYVRTVTPLADQKDIQNFIADRVSEGIVKGTPVASDLIGIVPDSQAVGKDADALQALAQKNVRDSVLQVIQSPDFQRAWHETNQNVHDKLISQLSTDKYEISLDFNPLANEVMEQMKQTELAPLTANVVLPENIAKVNFDGVANGFFRAYYKWAQNATWMLVVAAGAAAAIGIALSTHHIRTFRRIMMATGIFTLGLALMLHLPSLIPAAAANSSQKVAIAVGDVLFHDLKIALVVIGVTVIVLALASKIVSVVRRKIPKTKTLNMDDKSDKPEKADKADKPAEKSDKK